MQAQDIKTADDLSAWLKTLPPEQGIAAAQHIAHRAALRVLPIWAQYCATTAKPDVWAVPVFARHLLSAVKVGDATVQMPATEHAVEPAPAAAAGAAIAARENHSAVFVASASEATVAFVNAFNAATFAASGSRADGAVRASSVADVVAFQRGVDLKGVPLWPDGLGPFAQDWADAAPFFARHPAWAVFTNLYEDALLARPQNLPLLSELAQQDQDFWTGPDAEVLDRIAALTDALTNGAKPNVNSGAISPRETVVTVDVQSTMVAMVQNRQQLPQVFSVILGFIDLEIDRLQRRNYTSDADRDECQRQIRSLCIIKDAVAGMMPLIPQSSIMPQQDAEKAAGLIQVYANELLAWPRENVGEIVDNTYRLALIGATAIALPMVGVATPIAALIGAVIFGGPRLLENAQKAKKLLSGSTG